MTQRISAFALALCLLLTLVPGLAAFAAETPRTITYWIALEDATVMTNDDEGMAWSIAQEKANVDVQFIHPAAGTGTETFNLMIASNDLPDVISWNWLSFPGGPQAALDNSVVISLNDYLANWAPAYSAFLENHPDAQKLVVTDDGTHFCVAGLYTWEPDESKGYVSAINRPLYYEAHNGLILRKDYLDAVGLDVPVTVDDWTEVLRAFKNELGIEAPLSPVPGLFKNVFAGAYGICNYLYQDENNVAHYGPMEDAYRDYMNLLASWYAEGLLDADFAALDDTASKTKAQNGKSGAWVGYGGSWLGAFIKAALAADPNTPYYPVGAPHPVLDEADGMVKYGQKDHPFRLGAAVTTACKDVEAALTFLDYPYTDEGDLLMNWGVEGVSFERNENGLPVYTDLLKNNPDGIPITTCMYLYHPKNAAIPMDQRNRLQLNLAYPTPEGYNALVKWADSELSLSMPPYTIPTELVNEYANLGNEIKTYVDEMYMKFVMGLESLDNFDAYRETLRKLGVERYLEITQTALDNFNAR